MKKPVILLVVLVLGLCPLGAWAYPSFDGASGLVILPTAEVAAPGAVDVAIDYQKFESDFSDLTFLPIRVNAGVADKLELSACYNKYDGAGIPLDYQWTVGAKYAFLQEPKDGIGLAIGASYGSIEAGDWDSLDITHAYLALSKNFAFTPSAENPLKGRFSAGWSYMKFSEEMDKISKPYVGLEILTPQGACLGVEYRWKESDAEYDALLSAVARLPLSQDKAWWAEIGGTNAIYNSIGMFDEQKIFYGIAYRYEGK